MSGVQTCALPILIEMMQVPDLGPKKVYLFWKHAGITTLDELEDAVRNGVLRALPGIGRKSEAKIVAGIEALVCRSEEIGRAWGRERV